MKGTRLSMNAFCADFWFLPPLPYQGQKLSWHLCKSCFREESTERRLFKKGLEEAQWADVSPLLKNFMLMAQWHLAVDAWSKIFAPLPYQGQKLICTSVRGASERGQRRRGFLKKASKRPNRRTLVRFLKTSCSRRSGASLQTREARLSSEL